MLTLAVPAMSFPVAPCAGLVKLQTPQSTSAAARILVGFIYLLID
jgi:hypothetical protein